MEYAIVRSNGGLTDPCYELEGLVNEYLEQGWELLGSPFVRGSGVCQAMVKRPKSEVVNKVVNVSNRQDFAEHLKHIGDKMGDVRN